LPAKKLCDHADCAGHTFISTSEDGLAITPGDSARLSCGVSSSLIFETDDRICLGAFLALDDIELHIIALFQGLIAIQLDCGIVNENIWPIVAADESVALGVVKPLDLPFVLSHRLLLSLGRAGIWCATGIEHQYKLRRENPLKG
jgi:hypothetical protein